jgi:hypothetical protein
MTWCDQRLGLDPAADETTPEDLAQVEARLRALPVEELVRAWREVSALSRRARTPGSYCFSLYFDRLGQDDPHRALAFIEAMVVDEPNDALVALLAQEKLLGQLIHFNDVPVIDHLEVAAARLPRLRWLLGAFVWSFRPGMMEDKEIARRLAAIADDAAYKAWELAYKAGRERIDFAALTPSELARHWVVLTAYSPLERERDDNAMALFDYQWELAREDPQRALALAVEIARIEEHPGMLAILAAGLLEDLLVAHGPDVIDAVEAEARGDDARFRLLLSGVWISRVDPAVAERLAALTAS